MKNKVSFDNDFLAVLIKDLSTSLNTQITYNTNIEIDIHLERAKHDECKNSMNWLLLQFIPLIASIASKDAFHKKNNSSGRVRVYTFDYIREEDVQDLVPEMIIEFNRLIKEFNWETPFNSWIKGQLEWFAINYYNKNAKHAQREITSLNSSYSELTNAGDEVEDDFIDRTENHRGLWHKQTIQEDNLSDRELLRIVMQFVESKFDARKQRIYKMHFLENITMSEIAIKEGYHYHSTISNLVKEIRMELMEFLSKIDEKYDTLYEPFLTKKFTSEELKDPNCVCRNIESFKTSLNSFDFEFEDFNKFTNNQDQPDLNGHEVVVTHKLLLTPVPDNNIKIGVI